MSALVFFGNVVTRVLLARGARAWLLALLTLLVLKQIGASTRTNVAQVGQSLGINLMTLKKSSPASSNVAVDRSPM